MQTFKIVLLGDENVGKTTWVKRMLTGEFTTHYVPTLGLEVHPLAFHTNVGKVCLNVWDLAGQEKYGGIREGYLIGAQGAIIMYDGTLMSDSYLNVMKWYNMLPPNIPVIVCANKADLKCHIQNSIQRFIKETGRLFYQISARSAYNFEKAPLALIRELLHTPTLHFVASDNSPL